MISFDSSNLLYTKPIEVVGIDKKTFYIKYSTEMQKEFQNRTLGIFGNTKTDERVLFAHNKRGDTLHFPNLCLFPCTTIYELKEILALSLEINPFQIDLHFMPNDETYPSKDDMYTKYISIGFSNLKAIIRDMKVAPMTFYENTFYKNYIQIGSYVNTIIKNTTKQGITKLSTMPNISSVSVVLAYKDNSVNVSVDISKMFNIHTAGNRFSKVYIQSQKVDADRISEREMQYVKISSEATNPFNAVDAIYEACALYLGEEISNGIILSNINVYTNGIINVNFTSINSQLTYDDIKEIIKKWLDKNMLSLLDSTCVDECVYSTAFDVHKYKYSFGSVTSTVSFSNGIIDDINEITTLTNQTVPTVKFPTRTSIQFSMYTFNCAYLKYKYLCLLLNKDFLTENVVQKSVLPTCHAGINVSNDVITVSSIDATSYDESMYHYAMILGIFSQLKSFDKSSKAVEEGATFKQIQKRAMSINKKQLLKVLYSTDPTLFGERKIGASKKRPYSGLAQKVDQRVVPITADEYAIVKKERPESVADIQNQTFKAQRLYLFCPYNKTPYVNFHSILNQICIPRCTTKLSNKSQLSYCINGLDARDIEVGNGAENQSITLYNPIITRGRKCKLPNELNAIFPNYICVKLNVGLNDVNKYYEATYGKKAFVIKRDNLIEKYEILTEYNKEEDYILTLFAERTKDDVFMVTFNDTPLLFSQNPTIRDFFSRAAAKTSTQLKFFDFTESITKKPLNEVYSLSVNEIIRYIAEKHHVTIAVTNDTVFGIIYNNKVFFSPQFYWQYNSGKEFVQLKDLAMMLTSGKATLPKLADFNPLYINELYIDYETSKVRGIMYKNVFSFTMAEDVPSQFAHFPKIQFDFKSVFKAIVLNTGNEETSADAEAKMIKYIDDLRYMYLFIYLIIINNTVLNANVDDSTNVVFSAKSAKNIQNYKFEKADFLKFMKDNKFLGTTDQIVFLNDERKFVSWRKSKLSVKTIESLLDELLYIDTYTITQIIYDQLQQTLKINLVGSEKLYSKIIT